MLAVGYLLIVTFYFFMFHLSSPGLGSILLWIMVSLLPLRFLNGCAGRRALHRFLETSELYAWRGTKNPEDDRNPEPRWRIFFVLCSSCIIGCYVVVYLAVRFCWLTLFSRMGRPLCYGKRFPLVKLVNSLWVGVWLKHGRCILGCLYLPSLAQWSRLPFFMHEPVTNNH